MEKKIQDYSDEILQNKTRIQKILLGFYILIITILAICSLIITMKKGINVFIFMPFVFMFFLFRTLQGYKNLREETKKRNLQ